MILSNRAYDILKWIVIHLLPALGTLLFVLAEAWDLSYGTPLVGTVVALDMFVGTILGISKRKYVRQQKNEANPEKK